MSYVYLAGPISDNWRREATGFLMAQRVDIFDPAAAWGGGTRGSGPAVARLNLLAVRLCGLVLARYVPDSYGTSMEIGYALAFDHPVVLFGDDMVDVRSKMLQHGLIHKCHSLQAALATVRAILEEGLNQ